MPQRTVHFHFCVTPKIKHISSLHHVSLNNSKILTTDTLHWLELIAAFLSFLNIFSLRKMIVNFLNISKNLRWNQQQTLKNPGRGWVFKSNLQKLYATTYIILFLPDPSSLITVSSMSTNILPYLYLRFLFLLLLIALFFLTLLPTGHISKIYMFLRFHYISHSISLQCSR